jgi:uncharacterized membrane protein
VSEKDKKPLPIKAKSAEHRFWLAVCLLTAAVAVLVIAIAWQTGQAGAMPAPVAFFGEVWGIVILVALAVWMLGNTPD